MSGKPSWKNKKKVKQDDTEITSALSAAVRSLAIDNTGASLAATLLTNHFPIIFPSSPSTPLKPKAAEKSATSPSSGQVKSTASPKSSPPTSPTTKTAPQDYTLYRYTLSITRKWLEDEEEKKNRMLATEKDPNVLQPKSLRRLIFLLMKRLASRTDMRDVSLASDYNSFLVSCKRLPDRVIAETHEIILYGDHEKTPGNSPVCSVSIKVNETEYEYSLPQMAKPLSGMQHHPAEVDADKANTRQKQLISMLNAIFTHAANTASFSDLAANPATTQTVARVGSKKFFSLNPDDRARCGPFQMSGADAGFQARLGFFLSTRCNTGSNGRLLLNVNPTTSAFFPSGNLLNYLNWLPRHLDSIKTVENLRVRTTYMSIGSTRRSEAVHAISRLPRSEWGGPATAGELSFNLVNKKTGATENISVAQYFRNVYPNACVQDNWRVVGLGSRPDYIPAKLLEIVPGQVVTRTTEIVMNAVRPPKENLMLIQNEGKRIFGLAEIAAKESTVPFFGGLAISQDMLRVRAHVLNSPAIAFTASQISTTEAGTGAWNLRDRRFIKPATATKDIFSVLALGTPDADVGDRHIESFQATLTKDITKYGMKIALWPQNGFNELQKLQLTTLDNAEAEIETRVNEIINKGRAAHHGNVRTLKLLFVLLPERSIPLYAIVKRICEQQLGIQTICHVCKTYRETLSAERPQGTGRNKASMSGRGQTAATREVFRPTIDPKTIGNLLMKFNLKMDKLTANQRLGKLPSLLKNAESTMLMGMDVTHAGSGAMDGAPSIAAVVGNTDDDFAQFPAVLKTNPRLEPDDPSRHKFGRPNEQITGLREMAEKSIGRWMEQHGGQMPKRLIVFRDGLSEDQFEGVCKKSEVPLIREALNACRKRAKPSPAKETELLVICTVKRHHTRFFGDNLDGAENQAKLFPLKQNGNAQNNPLPGTVVEDGVVLGTYDDFYLISHHVIGNGTARPTHYVTLVNDVKASKREIAIMTHHLCFLFGRSTTSVGLVPPAYYADLAADRARCYARNIYAPTESGLVWDEKTYPVNLDLHKEIDGTMFYI